MSAPATTTEPGRRPARAFVLRAGPISARVPVRTVAVCGAGVLVVILISMWALTLGSFEISVADIVAAFTGDAGKAVDKVVFEWRMPRILAASIFGASLAIGGAIFQSLTRNPLGSPDVIGFTTGSYTGAIVALFVGASGYLVLGAASLVGGLVTAFAVYFLAYRRGLEGFRLIIVGIAVGAILSAINTWFLASVPSDLALSAAVWGAGTLAVADATAVGAAAVVLVVVAAAAPWAERRMRRLELGDDTATALGVPVERTKVLLIGLGILATAVVTAVAGPIAFIALAAPQIARRLTAGGASVDLAASAVVGAVLLLVADIAAQYAIPGVTLPTGAVTVCLGGAYLVWLLAVESRRSGKAL